MLRRVPERKSPGPKPRQKTGLPFLSLGFQEIRRSYRYTIKKGQNFSNNIAKSPKSITKFDVADTDGVEAQLNYTFRNE